MGITKNVTNITIDGSKNNQGIIAVVRLFFEKGRLLIRIPS